MYICQCYLDREDGTAHYLRFASERDLLQSRVRIIIRESPEHVGDILAWRIIARSCDHYYGIDWVVIAETPHLFLLIPKQVHDKLLSNPLLVTSGMILERT